MMVGRIRETRAKVDKLMFISTALRTWTSSPPSPTTGRKRSGRQEGREGMGRRDRREKAFLVGNGGGRKL